jgi:hypothetical protein
MPLVDKLERIGALLQNGTLSPEEFHQAKDQLLKQPSTGAKPTGALTAQGQSLNQAGTQANRVKSEYQFIRQQCLVRDSHFALREPQVYHLLGIFVTLVVWLLLGILVVAGFSALNPTLAALPLGIFLLGALLMVGSIFSHLRKVIRLGRAKQKYRNELSRLSRH